MLPDSNPESNSSVAQVTIDLPLSTAGHDGSGSSPVPPPLHIEDLPPPKPDFSAPPPYEVAAKLPTYEEVQREKSRLGEPQINNVSVMLKAGNFKVKLYRNKKIFNLIFR